MSLENELEIKNLQKELKEKEGLIIHLNEKISQLKSELNETKIAKVKFEGDLKAINSEMKLMEIKIKNTEEMEEKVKSLSLEQMKLKQQLSEYRQKNEYLLKDREDLLNEKAQILEEKNERLQEYANLKLKMQEREVKIADLKAKFNKALSQILIKQMDFEKNLNNQKELEETRTLIFEELVNYKQKVAELQQIIQKDHEETQKVEFKQDINLQGTGIISNLYAMENYFKNHIKNTKRNIRLVLPNIRDLERYGLLEILNNLPENVNVWIAGKIDQQADNGFIQEIRKRYQIIDYSNEGIFALNIDSATISIGITRQKKTIGIFTDSIDLINIFKPTIMEPFIRGRKVS